MQSTESHVLIAKTEKKKYFTLTSITHYENTNHHQMHKESLIINRNTLLHVSTLLGHLQGELPCYRYTKIALCCGVRMCC
jgi:hypothetical protein